MKQTDSFDTVFTVKNPIFWDYEKHESGAIYRRPFLGAEIFVRPGEEPTESQIEELVEAYGAQTSPCSFYHHAKKVSTACPILLDLGERAVPALLRALLNGQGGMHQMHLLGEITGEWPSAPADKPVADGLMVATNVSQARDLWVAWGKKKGLIE